MDKSIAQKSAGSSFSPVRPELRPSRGKVNDWALERQVLRESGDANTLGVAFGPPCYPDQIQEKEKHHQEFWKQFLPLAPRHSLKRNPVSQQLFEAKDSAQSAAS